VEPTDAPSTFVISPTVMGFPKPSVLYRLPALMAARKAEIVAMVVVLLASSTLQMDFSKTSHPHLTVVIPEHAAPGALPTACQIQERFDDSIEIKSLMDPF